MKKSTVPFLIILLFVSIFQSCIIAGFPWLNADNAPEFPLEQKWKIEIDAASYGNLIIQQDNCLFFYNNYDNCLYAINLEDYEIINTLKLEDCSAMAVYDGSIYLSMPVSDLWYIVITDLSGNFTGRIEVDEQYSYCNYNFREVGGFLYWKTGGTEEALIRLDLESVELLSGSSYTAEIKTVIDTEYGMADYSEPAVIAGTVYILANEYTAEPSEGAKTSLISFPNTDSASLTVKWLDCYIPVNFDSEIKYINYSAFYDNYALDLLMASSDELFTRSEYGICSNTSDDYWLNAVSGNTLYKIDSYYKDVKWSFEYSSSDYVSDLSIPPAEINGVDYLITSNEILFIEAATGYVMGKDSSFFNSGYEVNTIAYGDLLVIQDQTGITAFQAMH